MHRRRALVVVAAAALAPVHLRAGALDDPIVWAWSGARLWRVHAGDTTLVSDALRAGTAPVPVAAGCFFVAADGALHVVPIDPAAPRRRVALDADVHALAAAADGRWTLAAHGRSASLLDHELRLTRRYEGADLARRREGAASWLVHHRRRRSFVVAWPEVGELWEIQLDPAAPAIHEGLVHDHRMGESIPSPGYLGVRRAPLARPLPAFGFASEDADWVAGLHAGRLVVVHLDVRRTIAELDLPGARPEGAQLWASAPGAKASWWIPARGGVHQVDPARWVPLGHDETGVPVQALAGLGDRLWGLAAGPSSALLLQRVGAHWQAAPVPIGEPLAMAAHAARRQLLVVGRDAWQLHAADGAPVRHWRPPSGSALDGAALQPW